MKNGSSDQQAEPGADVIRERDELAPEVEHEEVKIIQGQNVSCTVVVRGRSWLCHTLEHFFESLLLDTVMG